MAKAGHSMGLSTGFEALDAATGGLQPGTLWVVAGATSMGKSLFGMGLSRNIAAQGRAVGEIHLEMDEDQIGLRTATALAYRHGAGDWVGQAAYDRINPRYLDAARGRLKAEQWQALHASGQRARDLPIFVDARPGRTIAQIEAGARRLFRRCDRQGLKPGALLIDHEGLIAPTPGERLSSLLERASARGEALLAMAKRLSVPVIALAQITNEGARADGEERLPAVTDIKYGGALTQAASVVILLHRKAYYAERKPKHLRTPADDEALRSHEATLVIDKARGGVRGQVDICMDIATGAVFEPGRAT
jgi:replicative DNA helicase